MVALAAGFFVRLLQAVIVSLLYLLLRLVTAHEWRWPPDWTIHSWTPPQLTHYYRRLAAVVDADADADDESGADDNDDAPLIARRRLSRVSSSSSHVSSASWTQQMQHVNRRHGLGRFAHQHGIRLSKWLNAPASSIVTRRIQQRRNSALHNHLA